MPTETGVVLVLGRPSLAEHGALVAEAALALARAWPKARVLPALRRGNVMGALDMGLAPGILPGRVSLEDGRGWYQTAWGGVPEQAGRDTAAMLEALAAGEMRALVLLGADSSVTSPTDAWPSGRSSGPSSSWRWTPCCPRRPPGPMWSSPLSGPTSAPAPPPTSRAGSAASVRSWWRRGSAGRTG